MAREFSIEYPKLRPAFWAQNGHIQTIAAVLMGGQTSTKIATKHLLHLPDGDRLIVHDDIAKSWITGDRIAIIFHGLCGCHDSPYLRRIAMRLRRHGIRTIRVDMRGFGDSTLISTGHLHAGRSDDISSIVKFVNHQSPLSKISLVGFSLGGNIVLKYLSESKISSHAIVDSAIAVSPPIDLHYCSAHLRSQGNRIYDYYFTRRLAKALQYRRRNVCGLMDNGVNPIPDRLVYFDDEFTAPVNGYSGAKHYYDACSSAPQLKRINVPTILVAAADDPVVPFEIYDERLFSPQIEFVQTKQGGHLGFLGHHPKDPDRHWLDWRICNWLASLDDDL